MSFGYRSRDVTLESTGEPTPAISYSEGGAERTRRSVNDETQRTQRQSPLPHGVHDDIL
jgi:hypothetical protein